MKSPVAMPFNLTIDAFASALADPGRGPPPQTAGREHAPDARRFAVYRNNIFVSLIAALEARYPVARRLVGDEFFRAMARAFAGRNKPRSAVLVHYGADFPHFVAQFAPARDLAYLADVARIENAWVESYHSAEAETLSVEALAACGMAKLTDSRLVFHPAARLLRSHHPAASIWAGHQGKSDVEPPEHWRGEDTLVTRPDADVCARILPAGGYAFAHALQDGATLGEAHAIADFDGFDPGSHLIGLIEAGAISRLGV
jgi:hypothetical protein